MKYVLFVYAELELILGHKHYMCQISVDVNYYVNGDYGFVGSSMPHAVCGDNAKHT